MVQQLKIIIQGLYSHPNPLSSVPPGALEVADNLVVDREGEATSRRGFKQFSEALTGLSKFFEFQETLLAWDGWKLYWSDEGTWEEIGNLAEPTGALKPFQFLANNSAFFTSDQGILRLSDVEGDLVEAGVAPGLDISHTLTGASGFMPNDSQVAYRVLFGTRDENEVLILGAPGTRHIVTNSSGGTRNVIVTFSLPSAQLSTSHFFQLYRSLASVSATAEPGDELQLVTERLITSGELTAGLIAYTDTKVEDDLGAALYTNPTREGIEQRNLRPPMAVDAVEFKQHAFYANTTRKHNLSLTMITLPTANDNLVLDLPDGTFTYVAKVAESIASGEYAIGTTVSATLESLIRVINRDTDNKFIFGYSINGNTFLLEYATFDDEFTVDITVGSDIYNLDMPVDSASEAKANRIYISKQGLPQAVPGLSFLDLGSEDKAIQRVLANRDAVFVLKDDGVWRITGFGLPSFVAEVHDNTLVLKGQETAVVLDNAVYCMTTQGPVSIDLSGKFFFGRPIEADLLQLSQLASFAANAYGVAYSSDRKYFLACPEVFDDDHATQLFVYNYFTKAWTRWPLATRHGLVQAELLYLARDTDEIALQERKNYTDFDYADDEYTVSITGASGDEVTVTSVPSGVAVGMTIAQGYFEAVITDIDGTTLTVNQSDLAWANSAAVVVTPILNKLVFAIEGFGNPGVVKQLVDGAYMFRDARFDTATALTGSNMSTGAESSTIESPAAGSWGLFPWGEEEWGGLPGGAGVLRLYFPNSVRMGHWFSFGLELEQAFNSFSFLGMSITAQPADTDFRIARG